ANVIVTCLFVLHIHKFRLISRPFRFNVKRMKEVLRMGSPITVQRVSFIVISIMIAKIIAQWGPDAIAAQRIGIQIESISYMTIGWLQGAIAAFIGQNFGAHKHTRIKKGYLNALWLTSIFGILTSLLFLLFPRQIFSIFLSDEAGL